MVAETPPYRPPLSSRMVRLPAANYHERNIINNNNPVVEVVHRRRNDVHRHRAPELFRTRTRADRPVFLLVLLAGILPYCWFGAFFIQIHARVEASFGTVSSGTTTRTRPTRTAATRMLQTTTTTTTTSSWLSSRYSWSNTSLRRFMSSSSILESESVPQTLAFRKDWKCLENSDLTDNNNSSKKKVAVWREDPVDHSYYFAQHQPHDPTQIHSSVSRHNNNNNKHDNLSSSTAVAPSSATSARAEYYLKSNGKRMDNHEPKYSSDTPPTQSPFQTPRKNNDDDDDDDEEKQLDQPRADDKLPAGELPRWYQRGPFRVFWYHRRSNTTTTNTEVQQLRSNWRPRHARTAEEGIRRESVTPRNGAASSLSKQRPKRTKARQLSSVLAKANGSIERTSRHYVARTIAGLLNALAEEVADLEVDVESRRSTPWRRKHVDAVRIQFSRLGFKPLRMGGHGSLEQHQQRAAWRRENDDNLALLYRNWKDYFAALRSSSSSAESSSDAAAFQQEQQQLSGPQRLILTADEAFDRIDVDQSGYLDREELIQALLLAARSSILNGSSGSNSTTTSILGDSDSDRIILQDLASDLFELYDLNGDGVVDRKEYKNMVEDMAALRKAEARSRREAGTNNKNNSVNTTVGMESWMDKATHLLFQNRTWPWSLTLEAYSANAVSLFDKIMKRDTDASAEGSDYRNTTRMETAIDAESSIDTQELVELTSEAVEELKTVGSIVFSDLRMDLRQLVFGGIPVIKRISGPLILEPFRATMTGSFNREDIMNSVLLDMGLKRLVMRVVRKRVGGLRDLLEGAVFRGRSWKTFGGEGGPQVDITELTNVEFDERNKLIITGRARVRPRPGASVIEQAFKVRTSIGPGMDGRSIRLEEPELALVAECPESWETAIGAACDALTIRKPPRPEPLYAFFPIYSPFKLNDDPGFYLGEDNKIESLYIQDGALRFELSAVLRPGRFLGSHYIAFSVPQRTFIVTLDRVTEGIRSARRTKKAARALKHASDQRLSSSARAEDTLTASAAQSKKTARKSKMKSFFTRFVDGYLQAERDDADKERLTTAIREFFGRQESG